MAIGKMPFPFRAYLQTISHNLSKNDLGTVQSSGRKFKKLKKAGIYRSSIKRAKPLKAYVLTRLKYKRPAKGCILADRI